MRSTFRSLSGFNYRVWMAGGIVSNVGTWMQRIAQDWLVLTQLTHNNATAVGIVMALQFGPQVLFLPITGFAADHLDRRKLLLATQTSLGLLALALGVLTITGVVQLWHVYAFAFLLGTVSAFDAPVRQTFVSELVIEEHVPERGGAQFHVVQRRAHDRAGGGRRAHRGGGIGVGVHHQCGELRRGDHLALGDPRERAALERARAEDAGQSARGIPLCVEPAGPRRRCSRWCSSSAPSVSISRSTFSTMSVSVFHAGAGEYGVLTSTMAFGSVLGALLAAGRERRRPGVLTMAAAVFGVSCAVGALMPDYYLFGLTLIFAGASAQTVTTTVNGTVQLTTEPAMRGRVIAILLAVMLGGTPIGAPMVGWVVDRFGPRWGVAVGAASGFAAAAVGVRYLVKYRNLRIGSEGGRWGLRIDEARGRAPR